MEIKKKVNAKDGQVSPLDSGNVSENPPIISVIIIIEERKINEKTVLNGESDEIESLYDTRKTSTVQRIVANRDSFTVSFFSKINGIDLNITSPNIIPIINEKINGYTVGIGAYGLTIESVTGAKDCAEVPTPIIGNNGTE